MADATGINYLLEKHVRNSRFPNADLIRIAAVKDRMGRHIRLPDYCIKTILEVYQWNKSIAKTAEVFGCNKSNIGRILKRRGLSNQRPPRKYIEHDGKKYYADKKGFYIHQRVNPKRKGFMLHKVLWEERHGPISPIHYLRFKTDNREDFSDNNLELVTKAELFDLLRKKRWNAWKAA